MRRWLLLLSFLPLLMFSSTTARAADDGSDDDGGGEDSGTIVSTRAPKEKSPLKVRNKFFSKARRLEIAPFFGLITNNAFNQDLVGGMALAYHFNERFALEVQGQYGFLSGHKNQKGLAVAVLQLLQRDQGFLLEATDPGLAASLNLLWSPMYGKINPMGIAVINLDFFFLLGVGYISESVEMARLATAEEMAAEGDSNPIRIQSATNNGLLSVNLGLGIKIFVSRSFALRLDGRFYLSLDKTLDYSNADNAASNHRLDPEFANRLSCDGDTGQSVARCTTTLQNSFVLTVGGSIFVPKARVAQLPAGM